MAQQTTQPTTTAIELSQDELSFIITLLNLTQISGFSVPSDFDDVAASAAGDSLAAQGHAVSVEGGLEIQPSIAALVMAGALYQAALGLSMPQGGGPPQRHWFYLHPERIVYHSKPRLGIERLELLADGAALGERIAALLGAAGQAPKPGFGTFAVLKSILVQAEIVRASRGDEAAIESLSTHNLPASFARHVLDELRQLICVTIRVNEVEDEVRADTQTHMFIQADDGYWLIQEDASDVEHLIVTPMDGEAVLVFLAGLVA